MKADFEAWCKQNALRAADMVYEYGCAQTISDLDEITENIRALPIGDE